MDNDITILHKEKFEIFEIELTASPGAGFVWKPVKIPEGLVWIETKSVHRDKTIGGSSSEIFMFKGIESGKYKLVFNLGRVWENHPINTKEFEITVE
jgi:predicted secreted protein